LFESPKIIVALDFCDENQVWQLIEQLSPDLCRLKVGKELFTSYGPQLVKKLIDKGFSVFLDLKFHDIPNTVAKACKAAADLGVWMLNVHAFGGMEMMQKAKAAIDNYETLLLGVTVLTSFNDASLKQIGVNRTCEEQVQHLAKLTQQAGLDGIVCSPQEARIVRESCGEAFCLVTPGVRTKDDNTDDQKRIVTPSQAIANGANYLVIGRPITKAKRPLEKLQTIQLAISES